MPTCPVVDAEPAMLPSAYPACDDETEVSPTVPKAVKTTFDLVWTFFHGMAGDGRGGAGHVSLSHCSHSLHTADGHTLILLHLF